MSDSLNEATLMGTVGGDPELKPTGQGSVVNLSIATTESWRDRATGEKRERTEWHDVVIFDKLAETVAKYYKKGMLVYVRGILRRSRWEGPNGEPRNKVEIHVTGFGSKISIVNDRGRGDRGDSMANSGQSAGSGTNGRSFGKETPQSGGQSGGGKDIDDEPPF
ncbi:single-stranded DNA-binding protein [Vibrio owensii]|uniref:single-stranded DNA-binding protein n=1 Tax=Vibrio owensii TaxID=696485 RepID=UPI0018F19C72|nr:single-stranded DNA-binding protein [Vibrio owensii]